MIYAGLTVNGIKMASLQPHCAGYQRLRTIPVAMNGAGVLLKNKTPRRDEHPGRVRNGTAALIPSNATTL
jgi:hypothetical protein